MRGLIIFCVVALAAPAHAGRTFYGWLYGTEVMPERGAELQTWISEENDLSHENDAHEASWFVQPLIGINDQLELALPVRMQWSRETISGPMPTTAAKFTFESYGAEVRYRFVTQDPVDAPPLVPLLRVAVNRLVTDHEMIEPQADVVVSYQSGRFHGLVDVGMLADLTWASGGEQHVELRPGAGVSIETVEDLRVGAEIYSELKVTSDADGSSWAIIGPNLAWSHGRSWLSAQVGVGLYHIRDAGRLQWGIAF